MILITTEEGDVISSKVAEWLLSLNSDVLFLSEKDIISSIKLEKVGTNNERIEIFGENFKLLLNDVKSYWYRRQGLEMAFEIKQGHSFLKEHLEAEIKTLTIYFHQNLESIKNIGNAYKPTFNKLHSLKRLCCMAPPL